MLPYVEVCLVMQSVFLNLLWIVLMMGWLSAGDRFPKDTLAGGTPSPFHWGAAIGAFSIVLFVSVYFFEPIYWFMGFALAMGSFLSVLNPAFALCFMMSMILMRPWEVMVGNELMLEVPRFSMFFAAAWAGFYVCVVDRFHFRFHRVLVLLLAYALWLFMSTAVTPNPAEALKGIGDTIVRAVVLFFLVYTLIRDEFSVWAFKVTLVTILACVGLIAIIFWAEGYTDGGRIIAFGLFSNTNDIAAVMTLLLPLAATPFFRKSTLLEKAIAMVPVSIALGVMGLAQSRGAIMSLGAATGVWAFRRIQRKTLALVLVGGILVGGYGFTKIFSREAGDLEGSAESRKSFMISGIRMALFNPVFGVGYGQFPSNYEHYATEITHEFGKRTAHSSWILALAESGWIGLGLYLAFFIMGAVMCGIQVAPRDPTWLFAAASYGVSMTFLSHTYLLFPFILVAGALVASKARTPARYILRERH
jgi:O-antigen ligase